MKIFYKYFSCLFILLSIFGCNSKEELKNDDYSFKVTETKGNGDSIESKIFLSNKSGELRENTHVKIYIHILDSGEKILFYENTYESLDNEQIVWDSVEYSNQDIINQMVVPDEENDTLKNNYEFVYEIYDSK